MHQNGHIGVRNYTFEKKSGTKEENSVQNEEGRAVRPGFGMPFRPIKRKNSGNREPGIIREGEKRYSPSWEAVAAWRCRGELCRRFGSARRAIRGAIISGVVSGSWSNSEGTSKLRPSRCTIGRERRFPIGTRDDAQRQQSMVDLPKRATSSRKNLEGNRDEGETPLGELRDKKGHWAL